MNIPNVLIVDDLPKNVKLLEAHLSSTGFSTDRAFDGEEALEKIAQSPPDIILLDVMMPKIDGFEVCRRVKQDEKTRLIPVVMITALDQIEDKVKGIEAGADDFLTKPVNRMELLARTQALVKSKRLNEQVQTLKGVLASLFEISTFAKRYSNREVLLAEFSQRAAELVEAHSVVVTLWQGDQYGLSGHFNVSADLMAEIEAGKQLAVNHVMENGEPLIIMENDAETLAHYGLEGGYIGVPMTSFSGSVFGALHAFEVGEGLAEEATRLLTIVAQRLAHELQLKDSNANLEREVDLQTAELQKALGDLQLANEDLLVAQTETIFRLAKAAEYRDEDTASHLHRMSNYAYVVAKRLGMTQEFSGLIKEAATMHDVGKIGIPDAILLKHGQLTADEYEVMKEHTLIGAKILGSSSSELLRMSERIALCHHEKYNGKGYPNSLGGAEIPIEARIVAISDVFDALTTVRVYKPAFSVEKALEILTRDSGEHFDPVVFTAFMDSLDEILRIYQTFTEMLPE